MKKIEALGSYALHKDGLDYVVTRADRVVFLSSHKIMALAHMRSAAAEEAAQEDDNCDPEPDSNAVCGTEMSSRW